MSNCKNFIEYSKNDLIHESAITGENASINSFVTIGQNVEIGEECFIGIESSLHQNSIDRDLSILSVNTFGKGNLGPCLKYLGNLAIPISINLFAINKSNENEIKILSEANKF